MVRDYDLEIDIKTIQEYMHNTVLVTTLSSKKSNVGGWQSPVYWSWSDELKELQTFVEKQIPEHHYDNLRMFPSDLRHGVRKNESHRRRISLAFNYIKITRSGITI